MAQVLSVRSPRRFGGASASRNYATKVQWLVGAMMSIIALLVTALVLLLPGSKQDDGVAVPYTAAPPAQTNPRILVARQRIEVGEQFRDGMFDAQEITGGYVPIGAILASERASVQGQYARELINAGNPISLDLLSSTPPETEIVIPPNHRAIAIPIDEFSSVAYLPKADTRVDVLLSFTQNGQPAVVPVVETVKILKMGTQPGKESVPGARTATILVTTEDARKVELAKRMGSLSLTLAGDIEIPKGSANTRPTKPGDLIDPHAPPVKPKVDGTAVYTDPKTGKRIFREFVGGVWVERIE